MPNSYLTSSDMDLIQRLLAASRRLPLDQVREKIRARFMVECLEGGMTKEDDLRRALADHSAISDASPVAESGTLSKLYRLLTAHRDRDEAVNAEH